MLKTIMIKFKCRKLEDMYIEGSLTVDFKFDFWGNYILTKIKVV